MIRQLALVVVVITRVGLGLFDHSWPCLLDSERRHIRRLCVTLQGLARLAVDTNDYTIGVAGKVHSNFHLDLTQLFFNLLLLLGLAPLDIGAKFAGDTRHFIEERKFSLVEGTLLIREA